VLCPPSKKSKKLLKVALKESNLKQCVLGSVACIAGCLGDIIARHSNTIVTPIIANEEINNDQGRI